MNDVRVQEQLEDDLRRRALNSVARAWGYEDWRAYCDHDLSNQGAGESRRYYDIIAAAVKGLLYRVVELYVVGETANKNRSDFLHQVQALTAELNAVYAAASADECDLVDKVEQRLLTMPLKPGVHRPTALEARTYATAAGAEIGPLLEGLHAQLRAVHAKRSVDATMRELQPLVGKRVDMRTDTGSMSGLVTKITPSVWVETDYGMAIDALSAGFAVEFPDDKESS